MGKPGRKAVENVLPGLRHEYEIDLVVANGENSAGGFGVTPETAHDLLSAGVDVITSGNHIWKQKEVLAYIDEEPALIRPANYPPGAPGRGYVKLGNTAVVNLMGRVFMSPLDCPFRTADQILREIGSNGDGMCPSWWTSTPRRPLRSRPWPGIWTAESAPYLAHIPMCPPPTLASSPRAQPTYPT